MKLLLSSLALATVMGVTYAQSPTSPSNPQTPQQQQPVTPTPAQPQNPNVPANQNPGNTTNQTNPVPGQTTVGSTASVQNPNSIAAVAAKNNVSWEDAAAAIALAQSMNVDPSVIISERPAGSTLTIYQLAPAYIIANKSGKSINDIYGMYNGGQTWVQIANTENVPATSWNPSNVDTTNWQNNDFDNGVWQAVLMQSYGMTPDDYTYLTQNQMPENELVVGEVLARQDNTPVRTVMSGYAANKDWTALDQQYAQNLNNPPNQSQSNANAVVQQSTQTNTETETAPNRTNSQTTTQTNTQTTTTETTPVTSTNNDVTATKTATSASANPIEEWQVNGGDINPYNGWAESREYTTYALHRSHHHRRHHRRVRGHHRMRRRHHMRETTK